MAQEKLLVINDEENMVYQVDLNQRGIYENGINSSIQWDLYLVAGWDYIDPDFSDIQGWTGPENFIEDVQTDTVVQYPVQESLESALEENGYTFLSPSSSTYRQVMNEVIGTI